MTEVPRKKRSRLGGWLDNSIGLNSLVSFGKKNALKPVPARLSWAYTLGTLALFFFGIQFVTGFLLLARYSPHESVAYTTVQTIQHKAHLGWLIRQMHSWGASFVVIVLLAHLLKVLWYGSYKRPRQFTWFVGVFLLAMTLTFCFTGYILPWNQLARWATAVATDAFTEVPLIGGSLTQLILGGSEVSGETIGRFFALHVFLLPLILGFLVIVHLILVRWKGVTPPVTVNEEERLGYDAALEKVGGEPFFPRQVYKETLVMVFGFAILVTVATFFPWELGEPASNQTPLGVKPEWYFLPVYQAIKYFDPAFVGKLPVIGQLGLEPEFVAVVSLTLLSLLFFLLPILDRGKQRRISRRPFFALLAFATLIGVLALGILGYVSGRTFTWLGQKVSFDVKGFPTKAGENPADTRSGDNRDNNSDNSDRSSDSSDAAATAASDSLPAYKRADGLPLGGTCGQCHDRRTQLPAWLQSVHAAQNPPVQCVDCHGGNDTVDNKIVAHFGLHTDSGPEATAEDGEEDEELLRAYEIRRPESEEIIQLCGKCHVGVKNAFADAHWQSSPERFCNDCHSNHKIVDAGLHTFSARKAYKDESDPRTKPFSEIASAVGAWEDERTALRRSIEEKIATLRSEEFPVEPFEEELQRAGEQDQTAVAVATHTLKPKQVQDRIDDARKDLSEIDQEVTAEVAAIQSRWKLVSLVWAVTVIFTFFLARKLRSFGPPPAAGEPVIDDGDDKHDGDNEDDEDVKGDSESSAPSPADPSASYLRRPFVAEAAVGELDVAEKIPPSEAEEPAEEKPDDSPKKSEGEEPQGK